LKILAASPDHRAEAIGNPHFRDNLNEVFSSFENALLVKQLSRASP
jgi:hypothetical protein